MNLNLFNVIFFITIMSLIGACNRPETFLHNFSEKKWNATDSVIFSFDIDGINNEKSISFFFRNNLDYPYRNIFLFIELHNDDRVVGVDTVQYLISNKYGQWLGRGLGKTRDNYFIFNHQYFFPDSGEHKIIIRHGMRSSQLVGAVKFGVKIE